MSEASHFMGGRWIAGTGTAFESRDPSTGGIVFTGRAATDSEVNTAVEAAANAFEAWSALPLAERSAFLEAFGTQLRVQRADFADAISRETGKLRWESLAEVDLMIAKIGVSSAAYAERCEVKVADIAGNRAITRFKPHGVMVVFGPFNFPGHLPNGHMVPALLAGNTVVLKPSRQAALVGVKMLELWESVGMPAGVVNLVQGGRQTGTALTANPLVNGVLFTGSAAVGKALHRAFAGRPETILALEMGGNNPLVVHEVADRDAAAHITALSAFITSGQRCTCTRRLIVPSGTAGDDFITRLVAVAKSIRVGLHTDDPEPFMGPVISDAAADELLTAQAELTHRGAKTLVEMKSMRGIKALLGPGIIDVTDVADRDDEELFGPLLQLVRVTDFEAALDEANRTAYGLAAGLLSDKEGLYEEFFRRVRAGVINWNHQTTGASGKMPFGGIGSSGNHRPSAWYAADYCSYPVASIEASHVSTPTNLPPGFPQS
jgi:succinylglutamic semialdehyde dehydrogenase